MLAASRSRLVPAFSAKSRAGRSRQRALLRVRAMSSGPPPPPKPEHWYMTYTYHDGYMEKRAQYRDEHLANAKKWADAGKLTYGGLLSASSGDPPDSALFIFEKCSQEDVETFAREDPYTVHDVVKDRHVKALFLVIGNGVNHLPK